MAAEGPRTASPAEVAKAVFWSFFGIRKRKDYDKDSATITPVQVVVAGLVGAALFVFTLIAIVKLVTGLVAA